MNFKNAIISSLILLSLSALAQAAYRSEYVLTQADKNAIDAALPQTAAVKPKKERKILVFDKTTSFRHYEGISGAKYLLSKIGDNTGAWKTIVSNDLSNFEWPKIKSFDCIVLNNTTGAPFSEPDDVLKAMSEAERAKIAQRNERLRENLIKYVAEGGGLFGIHAAADTFRIRNKDRYEPFLKMLGGDFVGHPWTSNMCEVVAIEDPSSPITQGLWQRNGMIVNDEIYMMGDLYDRSKLRVLMSLDADRSPVNRKIRDDRDIALVWIKNHGKGRVAYGAFGHSQKPYMRHPDINATYMRLVQFCCGDLPADVTPLEKPAQLIAPKVFDRPSMADVRKFQNAEYSPEIFEALDGIVFAFYDYNDVESFRNDMSVRLLDEILSNKGTPRYRALLAQLLDATGAKACVSKLEKAIAAESQPAVKDRLESILKRAKDDILFVKKSSDYKLPTQAPASDREILRAINFVKYNKDAAIPQWMNFAALKGDNQKAALIRALSQRGENADVLLEVPSSSAEIVIAKIEAVAKSADASKLKLAFDGAEILQSDKSAKARAAIAASSVKDAADVLLDMVVNSPAPQAALAADALAISDISKTKSKMIADFPNLDSAKKISVVKVLESFPDDKTFIVMAGFLSSQTDASVNNAIYKLLVKCAQDGVSNEMFDAVVKAYKAAKNPLDKRFLLRFAPATSCREALELCKKAVSEGSLQDACRYLAMWKNSDAAAVLVDIAKSAGNERNKAVAHSALETLFANCAPDADSFKYAFFAFSKDGKAELLKIALEKPDGKIADFLDKNGRQDLAKQIKDKIAAAKTSFTSSMNNGGAGAIFDGNAKSRWSSGSPIKVGMWVMLDFGYVRKISEIILDSASSKADFPKKVRIYAGMSEKALEEISANVSIENNCMKISFKNPVEARNVKIMSLDDSGRWWSIHEAVIK